MLSPEHPNCSPEVLGTTYWHSPVIITHSGGKCKCQCYGYYCSNFFLLSPVAQSETAVSRPVGMRDWT